MINNHQIQIKQLLKQNTDEAFAEALIIAFASITDASNKIRPIHFGENTRDEIEIFKTVGRMIHRGLTDAA